MKRKKLKPRIVRDEDLRAFYERTSSLTARGRVKSVRLAFAKPRRLVALRLEDETIAAIRELAQQKGLNFSTLMRVWITERLRQERGLAR